MPETTKEVGDRLVELCKQGKHREAIEELYADDAVTYEAAAMPPMPQEVKGKLEILDWSDKFMQSMEIHGGDVDGPYPCDDKFICFMSMDATPKDGPMAGQRMDMKEACHYTVKDGKIARAEFYYDAGGC